MVARRLRERWYLYGNDLALADDLLRHDLSKANTAFERAWLLKHWPSLGKFESAEQWLLNKEPNLLKELPGKATLLRVLQHQTDPNPWRAMVPPEQRVEVEAFCESIAQSDQSLALWLGGGLGDQLECLSKICDPRLQAWWSRLQIVLPLQSRQALKPFLQEHWPRWAPGYQFVEGPPHPLRQKNWLSWMSWFFCLAQQNFEAQPQVMSDGLLEETAPPSLLCCWRSKIDPSERHWAHLRSLPFLEIARVYERLVPWARCRGIRLIDLTAYRSDERQTLWRYGSTLELGQPKIRSLCDTVTLLRASRGVITVDTALVHLAAWFGWPTRLLLHLYPDERWGGCRSLGLYRNHPIQVLQQNEYNTWTSVRDALLLSLADWPWL